MLLRNDFPELIWTRKKTTTQVEALRLTQRLFSNNKEQRGYKKAKEKKRTTETRTMPRNWWLWCMTCVSFANIPSERIELKIANGHKSVCGVYVHLHANQIELIKKLPPKIIALSPSFVDSFFFRYCKLDKWIRRIERFDYFVDGPIFFSLAPSLLLSSILSFYFGMELYIFFLPSSFRNLLINIHIWNIECVQTSRFGMVECTRVCARAHMNTSQSQRQSKKEENETTVIVSREVDAVTKR